MRENRNKGYCVAFDYTSMHFRKSADSRREQVAKLSQLGSVATRRRYCAPEDSTITRQSEHWSICLPADGGLVDILQWSRGFLFHLRQSSASTGLNYLIAEIYHDAEASRKQSRVTGIARRDGWEKGRLSSLETKQDWAARRKSVSREANQYRHGILLQRLAPCRLLKPNNLGVDLSD